MLPPMCCQDVLLRVVKGRFARAQVVVPKSIWCLNRPSGTRERARHFRIPVP